MKNTSPLDKISSHLSSANMRILFVVLFKSKHGELSEFDYRSISFLSNISLLSSGFRVNRKPFLLSKYKVRIFIQSSFNQRIIVSCVNFSKYFMNGSRYLFLNSFSAPLHISFSFQFLVHQEFKHDEFQLKLQIAWSFLFFPYIFLLCMSNLYFPLFLDTNEVDNHEQ